MPNQSFTCLRCGHCWAALHPPDLCPNRDGGHQRLERRMPLRFFPYCRSPVWDTPRTTMEICANPQCRIAFEARSGNHGKGGKARMYHSGGCYQSLRNARKTGRLRVADIGFAGGKAKRAVAPDEGEFWGHEKD